MLTQPQTPKISATALEARSHHPLQHGLRTISSLTRLHNLRRPVEPRIPSNAIGKHSYSLHCPYAGYTKGGAHQHPRCPRFPTKETHYSHHMNVPSEWPQPVVDKVHHQQDSLRSIDTVETQSFNWAIVAHPSSQPDLLGVSLPSTLLNPQTH